MNEATMTQDERIRSLEFAVLHLSAAVNCLTAALGKPLIDDGARGAPAITSIRASPDYVREAQEHLKAALDKMSEPV
jgi:hypothetical protein